MTEQKVKEIIINAYIEVYGEEKWRSLTEEQASEVLHILLNDFAKEVLE